VTDHAFEVGLSFGGVPERLLIPFEAMTGFFDPSVQFGLKFAVDEALADNDAEADDEGEGSARDTLEQISAREKSSTGKPKPIDADNIEAAKAPPATKKTRKPKSEPAEKDARKTEAASPAPKGDEAAAPPAGAEVVSLEAFRKKK